MIVNSEPLKIQKVSYTDMVKSKDKLNAILQRYGIPFRQESVYEMVKRLDEELEAYKKLQIEFIEKSYFPNLDKKRVIEILKDTVSYTGLNITPIHINTILLDMYPSNSARRILVTDVGKYSRKFDSYSKLREIVELEFGLDGRFVSYITSIKDILQKKSGLEQILTAVRMLSREKDKYVFLSPTLQFTETFRITTSNPNIQGKTGEIKELIEAPDGYKLAMVDISGQEVHILLNGILKDDKLMEYYMDLKDPYMAILKRVGLETTKANKEITKIPVLGIMNGMSKNTAIGKTKNAEFTNKIYSLITSNSGFQDKVVKYTNEQIKLGETSGVCKAKGLLGGGIREFMYLSPKKRYHSDYGQQYKSPNTTLQNGFFQITAAEISCYCMLKFIEYIEDHVPGGLESIRPVVSIHDEFVILFKEELEEEAVKLIKKFFLPIVRDWLRFNGEVLVSKRYVHK